MEPKTIFYLILLIVIGDFFFERWLDYLNAKQLKKPLPKDAEGIYKPEEYKKAMDYEKEGDKIAFITSVLSFLVILVLLKIDGFAVIDDWIRNNITNHFIWLPLAFFGVLSLASATISLPFSIYSQFVIEAKYGFNKTTPKTFILDLIKSTILSSIIGGAVLALVVFIYQNTGDYFWLLVWIFMMAFSLFFSVFYTDLILPIFNKLKPLEENSLLTKIEDYCKKVNFPLTKVLQIDGSKRSTKANAFFSGMGKQKKIVLYDTLLEKLSEDEILAVLAHEVGHYKKRHILTSTLVSFAVTGFTLLLLSLFLKHEAFSQALGFSQHSFHSGILVFGLLFTPISMVTGILSAMLSRKHEYEADHFANKTFNGKFLGDALKKLSVDSLSNLNPHPWYVFVNFSHPTLLQRLRKLNAN